MAHSQGLTGKKLLSGKSLLTDPEVLGSITGSAMGFFSSAELFLGM